MQQQTSGHLQISEYLSFRDIRDKVNDHKIRFQEEFKQLIAWLKLTNPSERYVSNFQAFTEESEKNVLCLISGWTDAGYIMTVPEFSECTSQYSGFLVDNDQYTLGSRVLLRVKGQVMAVSVGCAT